MCSATASSPASRWPSASSKSTAWSRNPSRPKRRRAWAWPGRYILTPAVFDHIRNNPRGAGGEIQLTDGIAQLMGTEGVHAYQYRGKRYDCGSKEGFLEASVELALKHPELGPGFRQYLQGLKL